jgi:hypothetical protein
MCVYVCARACVSACASSCMGVCACVRACRVVSCCACVRACRVYQRVYHLRACVFRPVPCHLAELEELRLCRRRVADDAHVDIAAQLRREKRTR